jgi:lipopolysaccharide/colanic/teichoic acid biosynthesis glycosyltransferase
LASHVKTSLAGAHAAVVGDLLLLPPAVPHLRPRQRWVKRLVDVAGSVFLLILTAPVMILVAILVGLTSTGPVIDVETCLGTCGRAFFRFRFRTTIAGPEQETGAAKAAEENPRMARIGRVLRALYIDELPQLFNVLAGEMSLIGPRPEQPQFVKLYRNRFPAYEFRCAVKPGILSLAEIDGRYSTAPELKLHYDLKYIYQYSLWMDCKILLGIILSMLPASHAQEVSAEEAREEPAYAPVGSGIRRFRARLID